MPLPGIPGLPAGGGAASAPINLPPAAAPLTQAERARIDGVPDGAVILRILDDPRTRLGWLNAHTAVLVADSTGSVTTLHELSLRQGALFAAGFSRDQVEDMATQTSSASVLRAVARYAPALIENGFAQDGIAFVAARRGGGQVVEAMNVHRAALGRHFAPADIARMAAEPNGAEILRTLGQHASALIGAGFTPGNLYAFARRHRGADLLDMIAGNADEMLRRRWTVQDIVTAATAATGANIGAGAGVPVALYELMETYPGQPVGEQDAGPAHPAPQDPS